MQANDGTTAIMNASRNGAEAVLKLLLSWKPSTKLETANGSDQIAMINATRVDGRCALSLAAEFGHGHVLKILLENGASIDLADGKGRTPLMFAAENSKSDAVRILLENGADINATDHEESTPIMLAFLKGHDQMVGLLRDHGASLDVRNKNEPTVLMLAADFADNIVMRELLQVESVLNDSVEYLRAGKDLDDPVSQETPDKQKFRVQLSWIPIWFGFVMGCVELLVCTTTFVQGLPTLETLCKTLHKMQKEGP